MGQHEAWVNEQMTFDASLSHDEDGVIIWPATWELGDGTVKLQPSPGEPVTHSFQENDTYQVNLTVEDNNDATTTISTSIDVSMQHFRATWDQNATEEIISLEYPADDTYVDNNETWDDVMDLDRLNITKVWANFTWVDNEIGSEADEFTFRINTSFDKSDLVTTTSGEVNIYWERQYREDGGWRTRTFFAASSAEAEIFANGLNMTDDRWSGAYEVDAFLVTGHYLFPYLEDLGEDFSLTIDVEYYEGPPTIERIE
jgi:hypothetical protein